MLGEPLTSSLGFRTVRESAVYAQRAVDG